MTSFYDSVDLPSGYSLNEKVNNTNQMRAMFNYNPQKHHLNEDGSDYAPNEIIDKAISNQLTQQNEFKITQKSSQKNKTFLLSPQDQQPQTIQITNQSSPSSHIQNQQNKSLEKINDQKQRTQMISFLQLKIRQAETQLNYRTVQCSNLKIQNNSLSNIKNQLYNQLNIEQQQNRNNLAKIMQFETEISILKTNYKNLQQRFIILEEENNSLSTQLAQYAKNSINKNLNESQSQKLYQFSKQKQIFSLALKQYQSIISIIQKQKQSIKNSLQNLEINNQKLKEQINFLQHKNAKLQFEKKSLTDQVKQLEIYSNDLQQKNSQFNQTINNLEQSFLNTSKLQDELNKTILQEKNNKELQKFKQNQMLMRNQIEALKLRNNELLKQITELKILIGQKDDLNNYSLNKSFTIQGLWSPKNSQNSQIRQNSYLSSTEDKLSEVIFKNHLEVQRHKQAKQKLQVELYNLRSQYQTQYSTIQHLQTQLRQQIITFQMTLKNIESGKQFQIQSLRAEIKNLKNQLQQHIQINKKKNEQINQKQTLLQKWVSQKNLNYYQRK